MMRSLLLVVLLLAASAPGLAADGTAPRREPTPPLAGLLSDQVAWQAWRERFVSRSGRVIDTVNQRISHSEGQGYGMLLAAAAGDRDAFDRIWGWTRANLFIRGDQLAAWRWEPDRRPAIADTNNASDGDILIAWALTEAFESWRDPAHKVAARRIAVEIGRKLVIERPGLGALLLPGIDGFAPGERPDGPVVNLSYWVFPAFDRLPLVAPEHDWARLAGSGLALIAPGRLPADWTALAGDQPKPATNFPAIFGHNALRVPLYLIWAGHAEAERHGAFLRAASAGSGLPIVDLTTNRPVSWLPEAGYAAIVALSACAATGRPIPLALRRGSDRNADYYPATLHLLVLIAARARMPRCLTD